jgi:ParB family chromosome partitioning protein
MARGQRTSLASLASAVGEHSPVENSRLQPARSLPLADLTPNPRNPRDDVGTLEDLASIADMQLQPAVVVTRAAYLALYPDDAIEAKFVVVNGCRRLAAAHKYGLSTLDIIVNDAIARDRVTLISASIAENVDRQDFDVIEEAKAVEALVKECGRADDAAIRLRRTPGWVSQRRALLKLAPELQAALRRGELAIRQARSLAQVPLEEQVARWRTAVERRDSDAAAGERDTNDSRPANRSRVIAGAVGKFDVAPELLADALHTYLGADGVQTLLTLLANRTALSTAAS